MHESTLTTAHRSGRQRMRWTAMLAGATLVASGAVSLAVLPANAADCSTVPWMNTSASASERAQALLDASSQHQKYRWLVEQPANTPQQTTFSGVTYPVQVDCTPTVVYTDGPDGVRFTNGVTAFPAPISYASTWNLDLTAERSTTIASESFDTRKNGILAPGLASGRTPLSGRTPEYFGEDPLLTGTLAAAAVEAFQNVPGKPVMADLKHYVANEQEVDRSNSSSNIDERTLRQVYDLPVEIVLAESEPASVMCSYNQINGVWACENPLLNTNLKNLMGFDGYVVSDFGAVHSTAAALNNGLDQELNRPRFFTPTLLDGALAAGQITQARIDEAAKRVVTQYIEKGLFDTPLPATAATEPSTAEHKAQAREGAEQGSVLLKNDGALPLSVEAGQSIAVIGATASSTPTGGVSARTICSMAWQGGGNTMNCEDIVSAEAAITARAAEVGATVTFNPGTDVAAAAALAASSDVVVVFGYQRMGEFSDLANLSLQGNGDALIDAVATANPDTIAVLQTGSAVEMPWLDKTAAVLETWYAGEQMGPALVSLLWGDVNPSGKLPMTFPRALADTPTGTNPAQYPGIRVGSIRQVDFTEGLEVGYKWYDEQGIEPLFEFGHGLSYTTYEYADLDVASSLSLDGEIATTVSFDVTNTGDVAGSEIPQVYLELPAAADEPGKRLVGFDRVDLAAGETKRVEVAVDSSDANRPYSVWNVDRDAWQVVEGDYTYSVGASSRDLPLTTSAAVNTLDVSATVGSRCAAGKNQLTVTARNADSVPVTVNVESDFGAKVLNNVQPGKSASHAFTTKLRSLPAGDVAVTATAVVNGRTLTATETVAYEGRTCG